VSYETRNAGDTDDVTAALLSKIRKSRTDHAQSSEKVSVEFCANTRLIRFLNGAYESITGIVENNVELAEVHAGARNSILDLSSVGHIQSQRQNRIAITFLKIGNRLKLACGDCHFVAAVECSFCPDSTETAGCTSDKPDFLRYGSLLRVL